MRLALLPGLLLALALTTLAAGALPAHAAGAQRTAGQATLFSIAAQATTTSTLTTQTAVTQTGAITATATSAVAVTATTGLTATGSLTSTATPPAALPVGQGGGGGNLKVNPFDWAFLTSAPAPTLGPFSWAYMALMVFLFGISAYFYLLKRPGWKREHPVRYRAATRWAPVGLWISLLTLLFLLFRVLPLDFFNLRIWLYLWALVGVGVAAYFYYWLRTVYPQEVVRHEKSLRARQYTAGTTAKAPRAGTSRAGRSTPLPSSSSQPAKKRKKK